jgi:hypothetical protein
MADLKISQLPAATTPLAGTEVLPIVQSGGTVKVSVDDLTTGKAVSALSVSAATVTATTVNATTLDTNVAAAGVTLAGTTLAADGTDTNIDININPKGTGVVTTSSTYNDVNGKVRAVPQSGSAKTSSYTLAVGDVGEYIEVGTGGSITIPDATFAAGDIVSVFNNTTGNITITCSITTAYKGGIDTDQATVTLQTRGVATILFISGTVCVINGNLA